MRGLRGSSPRTTGPGSQTLSTVRVARRWSSHHGVAAARGCVRALRLSHVRGLRRRRDPIIAVRATPCRRGVDVDRRLSSQPPSNAAAPGGAVRDHDLARHDQRDGGADEQRFETGRRRSSGRSGSCARQAQRRHDVAARRCHAVAVDARYDIDHGLPDLRQRPSRDDPFLVRRARRYPNHRSGRCFLLLDNGASPNMPRAPHPKIRGIFATRWSGRNDRPRVA